MKEFVLRVKDMQAHIINLQAANAQLVEENMKLKANIDNMEEVMLRGNQNVEELHQEQALTKMFVDDLIKTIDGMISEKAQN